jgi:SAM-dependent methyltransferase
MREATKEELGRQVAALASAYEVLERAIARPLTPPTKHKACYAAGRYPFIPLSPDWFMAQLREAKRIAPDAATFIDVGCGIGSKVVLASCIGFRAAGIEIDRDYVKAAKDMLAMGWGGGRVFQGDALKHDYAEYDVVYFYCPMNDHELERQLEQRILETTKPGALILANLKMTDWRGNKLVKSIQGSGGYDGIFRRI